MSKLSLQEQLHRSLLLDRAVSQCPVAIWATDLAGEVILSEGGLLEDVGLKPGQVLGQNVRGFPSVSQWKAAKEKILLPFNRGR